MSVAETNNYLFQRPKRAVAIRRDGDDFVVSLMPNDVVIFRNESADALRKLCKGLRWAVVSDTAIASISICPTESHRIDSPDWSHQKENV